MISNFFTMVRQSYNAGRFLLAIFAWTSFLPLSASAIAPGPGTDPITVVAVPGEPFGVARIRIPNAPTAVQDYTPSVPIDDPEGRVFYPAWKEIITKGRTGPPLQPIAPGRGIGGGRILGRITNAIRTVTSQEVEQSVGREIWFLFQGDQPFNVSVGNNPRIPIPIRPQGPAPTPSGISKISPDAWVAAKSDWWSAYTSAAEANLANGDYPPLIESYLIAYLSKRMNLEIPASLQPQDEMTDESIASTLELLAGTEAMRNRYLRRVAQGDTERFSKANLPIPSPPQWSAAPIPPVADSAERVEQIASRVPANSYYLRFGSFANYLWFRDLTNQYGGDISRMVTLRGFDYGAALRSETQLSMKMTDLSRLLGDTIVEDTAFIGTDLFLTEGASVGVLLKAKNAFLLKTSLANDRSTFARNVKDATLVDITIADTKATFLSTPDNRIRSFLIQDGDYFLVTNSQSLAGQFIETSKGGPSLAQLPGFQYARELMPESNQYSIFAYFSEAFLQGLVSPQYQIELRRRLHATADIAIVQLAQIASQAEGHPLTQVDDLIAAGFLPEGISQRPDGSGPIVTPSRVINSRRGQVGSFIPIADVKLEAVTPEESAWYSHRAEFYSKNWQQMDPLIVGIRRMPSPGADIQRLQIHLEVAPLVPEKYGWIAKQLGPPTNVAVQFGPDDIAGAQAHVVSDQLGGTIPPHHLFVAIKDSLPPNPAELDGLLDKYFALKSLSGYLGAWPQPGLLDRLPLGIGQGTAVAPGMTRLIGGLYRYQGGGFSIISFVPDVISASLPFLSIAETIEPAQVRVHVDNLRGTQLESWANQQLIDLKLKTSIAGANLLDSLTSQLKVNPAEAAQVVNHLLDAKLQCPLGGEYRLSNDGTQSQWVSTAWEPGMPPTANNQVTTPLLQWFRGVSARLTQYENRLVADITLDMDGSNPNPLSAPDVLPKQADEPADAPAQGRRKSL